MVCWAILDNKMIQEKVENHKIILEKQLSILSQFYKPDDKIEIHCIHYYAKPNDDPYYEIMQKKIAKGKYCESGQIRKTRTKTMIVKKLSYQSNLNWILNNQEIGYNIYYQYNPCNKKLGKHGNQYNILTINALVLDFDNLTDFQEPLKHFPHPPTLINKSGGGYHYYWHINPVRANLYNKLQFYWSQKWSHIGADIAVNGCAQVVRLPGTINFKYGTLSELITNSYNQYNISDLLSKSELDTIINNRDRFNNKTHGKAMGHPRNRKAITRNDTAVATFENDENNNRVSHLYPYPMHTPSCVSYDEKNNKNSYIMSEMDRIFSNHNLIQPRTRHKMLCIAVTAIISRNPNSYTYEELEFHHDKWYNHNKPFINSSIECSRNELKEMYHRLLKLPLDKLDIKSFMRIIKANYKPHPRLKEIKGNTRKRIASWIYTSTLMGKETFLGYETIGKLVKLTKKNVYNHIKWLRNNKFVEFMEKGYRDEHRNIASTWKIPLLKQSPSNRSAITREDSQGIKIKCILDDDAKIKEMTHANTNYDTELCRTNSPLFQSGRNEEITSQTEPQMVVGTRT